MGKGNRTQNERAKNALVTANGKGTKKKSGYKTWMGTAILAGLLAVLLLVSALMVLSSTGVFGRMRKVAKSENYKITVPMMSYLVSYEYQQLVSMYNQYSSGTGGINIGAGEGGTALSSSGSYTLDDLRKIPYTATTNEKGKQVMTASWFDYFANIAQQDAIQILACCEAAHGNMELTQEDLDTIEAVIAEIEMYAALYSLSANNYAQMLYGEGVRLNDIREVQKLMTIASKWSEQKSEEFLAAVENGEIEQYYEEHKDELDIYCDYIGYSFSTTFTPSTKENADEKATENAELAAKYKAEQERFAGYVTDLLTATNKAEFTAKLHGHLLEEEKLKKAEELKKEVADLTEAEIAECDKAAGIEVLRANYENVKDNKNSTDLDKWLFETKTEGEGEDAVVSYIRKENDTKEIKSTSDVVTEGDSAYAKVSSSYAAYIYVGGMHRNNGKLRSVGHILFSSKTYDGLTSSEKLTGKVKELADRIFERNKDNADYKLTAYDMACELLDMLKDEGKITEHTREDSTKYYTIDESVFEEYGELYTGDSSVFYDDVPVGQMVEEFEDWLFDGARVQNEISYEDPVKTTYGYHIMFYRGNEKDAWSHEIKNTIASERQSAYLESLPTTYPVTLDSKKLRFLAG